MTTLVDTTVRISVTIDNRYELSDPVVTTQITDIPPPPINDDAALDDWEQEHIFPLTGAGFEEGDSFYEVTVTESSNPQLIPVGTIYEFGY